MALKFRRGTTAQQSGSLAYGEPYVNTTLGTLLIGGPDGDIVLSSTGTGSTANFGAISGSGLDITGDANIHGDLTLGGKLTIGDATSDTINVVASISSSLIPSTTDVFDIGSSDKLYKTIYGSTISGSVLEIMSGSNPEIRLLNKFTDIEYHIQNGNAGHFQIHNGTTNALLFRFTSASVADGNQDASFYSNVYVSESLTAHKLYAESVVAVGFSGSLSGSVFGIGNVPEYSSSVESKIVALSGSSTTNSASVSTLSQSVYDTLYYPTTGLVSSISSSINQATASLSASFYDSIFGLNPNALSYSINLDLYGGFGNTGSFDELSGSIYRNIYGDGGMNVGLSGSIAYTQNMFSTSVAMDTAALYNSSSALTISASSAKMTNDTQDVSISNLNSYTSSLQAGIQMTGSTVSFLGDIIVYGTQSIINSTNLAVNDNLIYLNEGSTITNPDLGIVGNYNDGTYAHGGIFRDASDGGTWKVFEGYTLEPSGTIDTAGNGFALADFKADAITATSFNGTINSTNGVVSGSLQVIGILGSLNTYTGSNDTTNTTQNTRLTALEVETANLEAFTSSINTTIKSKLDADGVISSSVQLTTTFDARYLNTGGDGIVSSSAQIAFSGVTGTVSNAQLATSTISGKSLGTNLDTLTISTGLSGTSYNGSGAVTIANTGVLSITTNTGLSTNVSTTGNVTITNTGVTSVSAGTGVTLGATTGACSISIGQSVATNATPTFGNLTINGTITATGDITAYYTSDRRHKNNIQTIPNALSKVTKLNGVTWEWNDDVNEVTKSTPTTGLIAQEVQEVLPQVVVERENGYLGLDYSKMMGLLVEAIKEQQIKIDNLTVEVERLTKQKGL
jgi:hypothetical protein